MSHLDVGGNYEMTRVGAAALIAFATKCSALSTLVLAEAELGNAGAAILSHALPMAKSLISLDVGWCGIEDDGLVALAEALPQCALRALNLTNCRPTAVGFAALAAALRKNPPLKELILYATGLSSSGGYLGLILDALADNTNLENWGGGMKSRGRRARPELPDWRRRCGGRRRGWPRWILHWRVSAMPD